MKPILIDITGLLDEFKRGKAPTGIVRVLLAYVQNYYRYPAQAVIYKSHRLLILPVEVSTQIFELILNVAKELSFQETFAQISNLIHPISKRSFIQKLQKFFGKKNKLPPQVQIDIAGSFLFKIDYANIEHQHYHQLLKSYHVKTLFMVHDLIPITHPQYFQSGESERFAKRLERILATATGVITNSFATRQNLITYATERGQALPATVDALLAAGREVTVPDKRPITAPYFLILGTIEPRKNHLFLLQIWQQLIAQLGEQAPRLVIVGKRGWKYEKVASLLDNAEWLRGFVIEHAASDTEVVTYLHHAQALLFPSFAEGYGMPIVEALTQGTPVIASDLAVFREIAGDIPEYLDPLDEKSWLKMIMAYTDVDSLLRGAQLNRFASFKLPTWSDHFAKVNKFLKDI